MTTEELSKISMKRFNKEQKSGDIFSGVYCGTLIAMSTGFAYATAGDYKKDIQGILQNFIDIIGTVFQAVGVVLAIWGFVQLILAIRNDDPDSKTRASTQAVVGIVLIALPKIITTLGLVDKIGG